MATVFVSYAHADADFVRPVIVAIAEKGHDVEVDEKFLRGGDLLVPAIKNKVYRSNFVMVFLSPESVQSKWVSREICETIRVELETKVSKLVPCRIGEIDASALPEVFTKHPAYEPLYIDHRNDRPQQDFIDKLTQRLDERNASKFKDDEYMTLDIGERGLEIYLTGPGMRWERNSTLRYAETLEGYLLFGFRKAAIGRQFKHFVVCDENDDEEQRRIKDFLRNAGYAVTGDGDYDSDPGRWRIYFLRRDCPTTMGLHNFDSNNLWP
jgi:TIR domain